MSQIQNISMKYQPIFEPAAYFSLAMLAGSTRLIHYLPGASLKGLLTAATLSSATSYLYDATLHDPDHSLLTTLAAKTLALGVSTIGLSLLARSLNGRIALPLKAAATFGGVELVAAVIITKMVEETPLQKEHRRYREDLHSWMRLSDEEIQEKSQLFFDNNLPAIPLFARQITLPNVPQSKKWETLSAAQLSWVSEILPEIYENAPPNKMVEIYQLFLKAGATPPPFEMNEYFLLYLKDKPELIELLYEEIKSHPQVFHVSLPQAERFHLENLFNGKPPIPPVELSFTRSEIINMDIMRFFSWFSVISKNQKWEDVGLETRSAALERIMFYEKHQRIPKVWLQIPINLDWAFNLTDEDIKHLNRSKCTILYHLIKSHKQDLGNDNGKMEVFNARFEHFGLGKIELT